MDIQPLLLAQAQFIATLGFTTFFYGLALALAWVLLFFKWRAGGDGQSGWTQAYRFWVRIYALSFVLALATSAPLLVQLGTVWPGLMDKIGNVAGPLLGYAVLSIFVFKSCFLGVMLFGPRRVPDRVHTGAVLMVALGQMATAFWLMVLRAWMITPTGARLVDGRYEVYDWAAVIFNPFLGWQLAGAAVGVALTGAFLILGVTAWQALRRPLSEGEKFACRTALTIAVIASALQWPVGAGLGHNVARYQPARAAAALGYWHTGGVPDLPLFAFPNAQAERNDDALALAGAATDWLGTNATGQSLGLDTYSGMAPPIGATFWSFRLVLALAILMALVALITLLWVRRRDFDLSGLPRAWLHVLTAMMFSGALALVMQGVLDQFGLQPYAVNGTVTQTELLGPVHLLSLAAGATGYGLLYATLFVVFLTMLFHAARYGVVPVRKTGNAP